MNKKKDKPKKFIEYISVELFIMLFIAVLVMLGMSLNAKVMMANGGRMPVYTEYPLDTDKHFSFQDKYEVKMFELSDNKKISLLNLNYYYSTGDILLYFGAFFVICVMSSVIRKYYLTSIKNKRR